MNRSECSYNELEVDEACLFLKNKNHGSYNTSLYSLSSDCISCPYSKICDFGTGNTSVKLNVGKSTLWRIYNDSGSEEFRSIKDESGVICQFQPNLGEYGIYELTVEKGSCQLDVIRDPRNAYTPLVIILGSILGFLLMISLLRSCFNFLKKKCQRSAKKSREQRTGNNDNGRCGDIPDQRINSTAKNSQRVFSIDTFRGISILTMIFVNNGAGGYVFLEHATWNGLFVGDLVFPFFVWVMGVCIPLSLSSQLSRGISRFSIFQGIIKRSVLLFLIDLSLNTLSSDLNLKKIRIFGVLQRFAIAYAVVAILYTLLSPRKEKKYFQRRSQQSTEELVPSSMTFADFISLLPQWIVISAITGLHCAITFRLPVPGCPTGYLGPGGRHADGLYENCTGGAAGYIDQFILGNDHIYQRPSISNVYGSGPFDPEGILGCLTTILQTFLGVQAGKILRVHKDWKDRIVRFLVLAFISGCIGSVLHFTDIIPVNKNLWSVSFVLITTSCALVLFSAIYLLVDVTKVWRGGPFRIPGMNALVMYVGHRICYRIFPFHWKYGETPETHIWQTIAAVWDVAGWTIIAYILHRKRIYVSL